MEGTTHHQSNQKECQPDKKEYQPDKKAILLGLIEMLYKSNNINEETYKSTKRAIKQEVK